MKNRFATYPSLFQRHVFITGGASGIGAALVENFCQQGAIVSFIDIDGTRGRQLEADLAERYREKPKFIHCDVTDVAAIKWAVDEAYQRFGKIYVLINNAANDQRHDFLNITHDMWSELMGINLRSQIFTAQAVIPHMLRAKCGSIINMSSNCFLMAQNAEYPLYSIAKSAIVGLTRNLAREFGENGVRVNSLIPGWVMTDKQVEKWLTPEAEAQLLSEQCLKEKIYPDDICRVALFLASDDSKMITKQSIVVDAGRA